MTSARAQLYIDLDAITSNYATLHQQLSDNATCGACVKADAYGLGQERVTQALSAVGCEDFFVAYIEGGIALRHAIPDARIHVFSGLAGGTVEEFVHHNLTPVLNSLDEIMVWSKSGTRHAANIHVDTGMLRLGLPPDELAVLVDNPIRLGNINVDIVMSHLTCADMPKNAANDKQLNAFLAVREALPMGRASLANSSGIFLGPEYHFDLVRPGAALYGINPTSDELSPIRQVVKLQGKILQARSVDTPQTVGYGASHQVTGPGRIATVGTGYADGYLRFLSGNGTARIGDYVVPVVGPVSMDMISLDITQVPEHLSQPGMAVELIGPDHDIDTLAEEAGTIGYEILTSLGQRHRRVYHGGAPSQ
ncbi:MAG: alanine racemase [Rhodospirillales bacterium]|nr:alanine racemase [Rhodospirillales bacterium]MBT4038915.1 alanine racemase [Rhodospirillales bacterium]MBT4626987.1 alanine racemase [Rhodospirillales bacterium]MBT5521267.1 alanine racemase [Rhodospirillales bacterium]MBT6111391.1 alanine racemase [Rhodospirillales bacterium]